MRNIIKLSLTLAFVGIISAALLTAMHNVTDPIIVERREADYREALESFFPGFEEFESDELDEGQFDLIYDQDGELMGIMATVIAMGYDGEIRFNLAVDETGEIIGVRVVAHTETPGIGDVIERDSFKEQFIGKSYEDPITAGDDVDIISGSTVSTAAMINSIRQTTEVIAHNYLGVEAVEVDLAEVPDGTYEGTAQGFIGPIVVEVEMAGGEIVNIEVLEQEETATYFVEAYPLIPERIIEEQSLDVDTQTGATASANAIVNAVENALLDALGVDVEAPVEEEPADVDISRIPDGTYEGSAEGFMGPIVVEVEVAAGEIVSIEVLDHEDTPEYFREVNPLIPDMIIEEQDFDIDTETGATASAEGILNAVLSALADAEEAEPVEEEPVDVDLSEVPDGTYEGSAEGFMGPIVVEVEVAAGEIVSIEVLDHEDTPEYFREVNPLIPDMIIEEQDFDVDTQTGATASAEGILNAVLNALSGAIENNGGGEDN